MTNKALAKPLKLAADLIELTGGNTFRARAYAGAARRIERLPEPISGLSKEELQQLEGVGAGLAADIREIAETGTLEQVDRLLGALPPGLPDLLRIRGLGTKKVRAIWTRLGVTSLDELEVAAASGRLANLEGFGKKTAENVLKGIEQLREYSGRVHLAEAMPEALRLRNALRNEDAIKQADLTGEVRRQMNTVAKVELLANGDPERIRSALARVGVEDVSGTDRVEGTLPNGLPVVLCREESETYGLRLWETSSSDAHRNEWKSRFGTPEPARDEKSLFQEADLAFIPAPMREGRGEIDLAESGTIPSLVRLSDLRGTLHNHSTWSDGAHSLREMAEAARERELQYYGVGDHSRSLQVANGLSIERLHEQLEEIDQLNQAYEEKEIDFRVLSGSEVDILADGSLDFPDDVLEQLDVVVASIHVGFRMTEAEATNRLIQAVKNPHVDILGHPTGRLLLRREGYAIDHEAVLQACSKTKTAIEINANPYRLDLDWRWVGKARDLDIPISINPDAHAIDQLDLVTWGVAAAQKGGLTAKDCLNTRDLDDLRAWLDGR